MHQKHEVVEVLAAVRHVRRDMDVRRDVPMWNQWRDCAGATVCGDCFRLLNNLSNWRTSSRQRGLGFWFPGTTAAMGLIIHQIADIKITSAGVAFCRVFNSVPVRSFPRLGSLSFRREVVISERCSAPEGLGVQQPAELSGGDSHDGS